MSNKISKLFVVILILGIALPLAALSQPQFDASADPIVNFTILDTNDFHGQLEASGSNPGLARTAAVVNAIRTSVGAANVLLVDAGDEMQGSLLSNLQKGLPTIAAFNALGYNVATFGNHEFDWGQSTLTDRTTQATYPFVTANIVQGSCDDTNWTVPSFAQPFVVETLTTATGTVRVAFIGVTTTETPIITIASATAGLCFKDPANSIIHYYDAMKAASDVIVVLSHLGLNDGGYGYGIPVYGDLSLANKLITAGKPVPLIIGGHSHTNLTTASVVGSTSVVQAYYNGRKVGRADLTYDKANGNVTVSWQSLAVDTAGAIDPTVDAVIQSYSSDPTYQSMINQPIGYAQVDLLRNYNGDAMMGDFVDDAIYDSLNNDATTDNDVDMFFNNAGGIRTDWCSKEDPANPGSYIWSSTAADCTTTGVWPHDPMLLTYGQMFTILPFGNATVAGDMTGAQILQVLNQSATLGKGAIQPSGIHYTFYRYADALPGPQPYAWGAFDYCVINKITHICDPLDMNKTYRVGTNEFLAPAGGDNYAGFKYMTNISYWGDMLNAVDDWVSAHYDLANPYKGPNNDGMLDGRITRDGNDTTGSIIPITILHNNDSHGNLTKGTYVGYTQLATLINQERAHNPTRTLLLAGGDQIQGDSMMYFFKSAPSGFAADGTPLDAGLQTHPMMAVMNALNYDAMTLGNHEFNFGSSIFTGIFKQATFPLLGANVTDTSQYGLSQVGPGGQGVQPYIVKTLDGIKVAILGITNHRVPNYELPSNIVGLTFSNPIDTAGQYVPQLRANNDVVIALTHIGFTTNPKSVEVDNNVDTNLAAQVPGLDAIVGAHSHTNPASPETPYKFLPTIVGAPDGSPVLVTQAYRYNNTLGEVVIGVRAKSGGGYEVVSRAGQYLSVPMTTAEDPTIKAIVDPYVAVLNTYNNKDVGQTTTPIDTRQAFTQETNGANLQADASVWELAQHGISVDFHLSGAMTNKLMASGATPASPVMLKISDMFAGMPYENSLVVLSMNGPQLKAVLERAYRNYYYYKYVSDYGGFSYYTTCMIDTNSVGKIIYNDLTPALPDGNNVVSLVIKGQEVNFADASKYYTVSTVNYLAAGSCNFNDNGVSLWPLNQIVHDTQYYVRDAVIDYIHSMGTVSPAIEGRLVFITDSQPPAITKTILGAHFTSGVNTFVTSAATLRLNITDTPAGLASCTISVAGPGGTTNPACQVGDNDLSLTGPNGPYLITVTAVDKAGNQGVFTETDILDNTGAQLTKTIGDPKFNKAGKTFVKSTTQFSVAADDGSGSGVAGCTLTVDGGTALVYTGANFSLPAHDGVHKLSVACTDNLGNPSQLDEQDIVDDTPPTYGSCPAAGPFAYNTGVKTVGPISAKDGTGSGVSQSASTLTGLVDTSSVGIKQVVFTAVDNLGNAAQPKTCLYPVTIKAAFQKVLADLKSFRATVKDKQDGKKLDQAIMTLNGALNSRYWVDGNRLPKGQGQWVFISTMSTVDTLNDLILHHHGALATAPLTDFIKRLADGDRVLAQVAVQDAVAQGGNPGIIALANKELTKGDSDVAGGRFKSAIGHYQAAWTFANYSLKIHTR
jgi:2',3'-cyclic-nucleotide 2'-phosphodiesterase (5'-nucleotidase family)